MLLDAHVLPAGVIAGALYGATVLYIPAAAQLLRAKGFWGVDLNKHPREKVHAIRTGLAAGNSKQDDKLLAIPESLGVVAAFAYFIGLLIYFVYGRIVWGEDLPAEHRFLCGALTLIFTTFLGFVDDVLDLRWRYKVWIPYIASIPLVLTYSGPTNVVIWSNSALNALVARLLPLLNFVGINVLGRPTATQEWIPLRAGITFGTLNFVMSKTLFSLFIINLCAYCSNAINIYAGINGLEVGQALVINAFMAIMLAQNYTANPAANTGIALVYALLFGGVCMALYKYNRYPSKIFVGDTFTMLAGIHIAAVAIMGNLSKILLVLTIPQTINFVLSLPQLLKIIHCPRHRIPYYDPVTRRMKSSKNLTLINAALELCGDMPEKSLTDLLLAFQVACGALALLIHSF